MESVFAMVFLLSLYFGWIPLVAIVNRRYPTQASAIYKPLIACAIYGLVVGLLAGRFAPHRVAGAFTSISDGIFGGFALTTCLAVFVTLMLRRAWAGAVLAPLLFFLVFSLVWWAINFA